MSIPVLSDLDLQNVARILNLPDPTAPQHAATRAYVDALLEGLQWKDDVLVATSSNVNLSSPGSSLDGVAMTLSARVLVLGQTVNTENGIYIWNGAATPMTRSLDANTSAELTQAVVTVDTGTSGGSTFRQTVVQPVIGTDTIQFVAFGSAAPNTSETIAGIIRTATQAEVDAGTLDLVAVSPLKLANWASAAKRFAATFGDGAATQYDITHNLGTLDVDIRVYRTSDNKTVSVETTALSTNVVRVNTVLPPALNSLRIVVLA